MQSAVRTRSGCSGHTWACWAWWERRPASGPQARGAAPAPEGPGRAPAGCSGGAPRRRAERRGETGSKGLRSGACPARLRDIGQGVERQAVAHGGVAGDQEEVPSRKVQRPLFQPPWGRSPTSAAAGRSRRPGSAPAEEPGGACAPGVLELVVQRVDVDGQAPPSTGSRRRPRRRAGRWSGSTPRCRARVRMKRSASAGPWP
jgi:hypothetical protein